MVKYRHKLNKPMAKALIKIYDEHRQEPVRISEAGLSHSQLCNFQKLKYWGLVTKYTDDSGDRKGGYWKITDRGVVFILNKISLPERVWTFRGEVVEKENKQVSIEEVHGSYQYRADWAEEARSILNKDMTLDGWWKL